MSKGIPTTRGLRPGDLYTTTGKDVWRLVSYCNEPTVTMENLETGEQTDGAVGCPNLAEFQRLVPDSTGHIPEREKTA